MQIISKEQLTKRFQILPEVLQDAVFSDRTADTIGKTCQLRDVDDAFLSTIATLTGRALLGYLRPETFAFEIQKETGIDALKATQVAHDIDTEIFSEVRLELKKLYPPTIQTPTVQSQGFAPREAGTEQKPRPYVVQIPERFKKTTDNSKLITHNEDATHPAPAVAPIAEQKPSSSTASPAKISAVPSQSVPPNESISYKLKASEGPPMDPVVPLPTFIQSKFKASDLGMAGQESRIRNQELGMEQKTTTPQMQPNAQDSSSKIQDSSKDDTLKNAFGKFTTPSTATGITKEPVSPYRETIEEPKKPAEQKPAAKVQGKVIDLSRF